MKPTFKAHGTKRLKLKLDIVLSNFALEVNLRRYTQVIMGGTSKLPTVKVPVGFD
jgi:hypothetical protein